MAKSFNQLLFDSGLSTIVSEATAGNLRMIMTSAAPTFATLNSLKLIDAITLSAADVTLGNDGAGGRHVTIASKTAVATGTVAAGQPLHIVLYNATVILAQTTEATGQAVTLGNNLLFPSFVFGFSAPV